MSHREAIERSLTEVFEEEGLNPPREFTDDLVLLQSGLDSLGFAVLVTKLEDDLGFDPFVESEAPFYPLTLGEFITFYDNRRA
jgi:acyl carrier protein